MALLNIKGLALGKKQRKDGRYLGRYKVDGKYIQFYARSIEALERIALEVVQGKKKLKSKNQLNYRQWAEKWLELYHKKKTSETTYKNDCGVFKNHIYPYLADKPLNNINAFEIQEIINKCPHSRQRQNVANLLTASLRKAYQTDMLKKDITKAVEKPRHEKESGVSLTRAEEQKLLEKLKGHELKQYIIFLLNSGLRRNEALGLQWKHLDFKNNTIKIVQQVNIKNEFTPKLKTKTSRRIIKMFPTIKKVFEPLKGREEERLFTFTPEYVTRTFKTICREIGLKSFTLRGTRTTFATRCAEKGIADKVVQAWLGHSKLDTTVNVYQKTNNEFIEQEFKKILDDFDSRFDS